MTLEQNIKQATFKSQQHKLAVNLLYTSHWLNYKVHCQFKNLEITQQQYNVLRILRGQYPNSCNLRLIKERMLDPMSDASRIIYKLTKKGFVISNDNAIDRRQLDLLISDKGLKLLETLDYIDDSFNDYFKKLNEEEVLALNTLLDKLHKHNTSSS